MQSGRITYDDMLSRPQTALQTCPRPALAHIPWDPQTTSNSFNESQQGFPRPGLLDWINRNVCDKYQFLPHRANPKLRCMRLIQEEPRKPLRLGCWPEAGEGRFKGHSNGHCKDCKVQIPNKTKKTPVKVQHPSFRTKVSSYTPAC